EACLAAVRLAMAYRDKYQDDVVIDLVGYRRHGHNEGDEPGYTQPRLYSTIASHPTVRRLWADRLVAEGVVSSDDVQHIESRIADELRAVQQRVGKNGEPRAAEAAASEAPDEFDFDTRLTFES